MRQDIQIALERVNSRRRVRRISENDVIQVLDEARRSWRDGGYGVATGGVVANAYQYPATAAAVAAIRLDRHTFALRFGEINARKATSLVSWFGPRSVRHVSKWLEMVRADRSALTAWILISRVQVLQLLRARELQAQERLNTVLSTIPDVEITVEDSIASGNCPNETERVAVAFAHQATNARTVAHQFPTLVTYIKRAAETAERRLYGSASE